MSVLGEHWAQLLEDLDKGFALLRQIPPAVTFFGGARIKTNDPAYALSQEIGRLLAEAKIPPRTGAGPGIMTSVPEGYKEFVEAEAQGLRRRTGAFSRGLVDSYVRRTQRLSRRVLQEQAQTSPQTQGIKIFLPFEPELNDSIDRGVELITFPIRRLMLYENALGLVVFPGGFGTLDELFEVWSRRDHIQQRDPIVLVETAFFAPLLQALRKSLLDGPRQLISPRDLDDVLLTDDPAEVVRVFTHSKGLVGFNEDPQRLALRLTHELPYVAGALRRTEPAVTFLGGDQLLEGDPALEVGRRVLQHFAQAKTHVRVGHLGPVAQAALTGYAQHPARLQGFFLRFPGAEADYTGWGPRQLLEVSDPIAHKLLLTQESLGFLFLPGGLRTLDECFSVLCEIQTGKMNRQPLVLLGSDYWRPIMDACAEVMLTTGRETISREDLELFTIVDTVGEALAALQVS